MKSKIKKLTQVQLNVMLVLLNMTMKLSNIRKKIRKLSNVEKLQTHVILILPNVMMEWSNARKKK